MRLRYPRRSSYWASLACLGRRQDECVLYVCVCEFPHHAPHAVQAVSGFTILSWTHLSLRSWVLISHESGACCPAKLSGANMVAFSRGWVDVTDRAVHGLHMARNLSD